MSFIESLLCKLTDRQAGIDVRCTKEEADFLDKKSSVLSNNENLMI